MLTDSDPRPPPGVFFRACGMIQKKRVGRFLRESSLGRSPGMPTLRLTIRNKLILFTVLPVTAVYSALFLLGVTHLRQHLSDDAQRLL